MLPFQRLNNLVFLSSPEQELDRSAAYRGCQGSWPPAISLVTAGKLSLIELDISPWDIGLLRGRIAPRYSARQADRPSLEGVAALRQIASITARYRMLSSSHFGPRRKPQTRVQSFQIPPLRIASIGGLTGCPTLAPTGKVWLPTTPALLRTPRETASDDLCCGASLA